MDVKTDWLGLLFEPGETYTWDLNVFPSAEPESGGYLVSMNTVRARRNDENAGLRTFLVEYDEGTLAEQRERISSLQLPFTSQVWSGSRSLHTLVVLEQPLPSLEAYLFLSNWLQHACQSDAANRNPCRLTRVPGGFNPDSFAEQTLVSMGSRVPNDMFAAWLGRQTQPAPREVRPIVRYCDEARPELLPRWTRHVLKNGIFKGKRNRTMYEVGIDLFECGFSESEALHFLEGFRQNIEQDDFPWSEICSAVKSAFRRASHG